MTEGVIGPEWDATLRGSPYRLRFELGGEVFGTCDAPVSRLLQALDRARVIADALFGRSEALFAVVACSVESGSDFYAPSPDGFSAVEATGFRAPQIAAWQAPLFDDDDAETPRFDWRGFDITGDRAARDALLWVSVTYEMPVTPAAPAIIWLFDPDRQISLHVYDDRGMDVTALARDTLLQLYRDFDRWLLDYDRPRMAAAFGG